MCVVVDCTDNDCYELLWLGMHVVMTMMCTDDVLCCNDVCVHVWCI